MKQKFIYTIILALSFCSAQGQIISTIVGDTTAGDSGYGGPAIAAHINSPFDMAMDNAGNIYMSDYTNNRICKLGLDGIITSIAGTGVEGSSGSGGPATAATFNEPLGLTVGPDGAIYFCDNRNNCVKKIDNSGMLRMVAGLDTVSYLGYGFSGDDGPASASRLSGPTDVVFDKAGNLYISDASNNRIRKINTAGIITTFAGGDSVYRDGVQATNTVLSTPGAMTIDAEGNLYVVSGTFNVAYVRKITSAGIITTITGQGAFNASVSGDGGPATATSFDEINGLAIDASGNLLLTQPYRDQIRKISKDGILSTVCGSGIEGYDGDGGYAARAQLTFPIGVIFDKKGNMLISEFKNVRSVNYDVYTATPKIPYNNSRLSVLPNPSNGTFQLHLPTANNEVANIVVMDIAGQKVKELTAATNTNVSITMDVPAGNYIVMATTVTGKWIQQVTIQ